MRKIIYIILMLSTSVFAANPSILIEAESFENTGGWVIDPQFVEEMGSPYLLAHGLGKPVKDCKTSIDVPTQGTYQIWVRTKNWASGNWEAPGRFLIALNDKKLPNQLGTNNPSWFWEYAGEIVLSKGKTEIALQDLTGFDGRCDAIYLTTKKNDSPPNEREALSKWRRAQLAQSSSTKEIEYDFVVVGGGIAGCAAAISAAEQGLKVALIHDRPILGGNASSEVRVHTLGIYGKFERILKLLDTEHYPNGSALAIVDQDKRTANMAKFKNIDLFLNYRAFGVEVEKESIRYVNAKHIANGKLIRFRAPFFVDCSGDGWIGYWAGCEYRYGRETATEFGESWDQYKQLWSPNKKDNRVMGASLLWNSYNIGRKVTFPAVPWAMETAQNYVEKNGEWQWEYTNNELNQVNDAEQIRDHVLKAIYGSFYNYKHRFDRASQNQILNKKIIANYNQQSADSLDLKWVSFILGKRESRRIIGDYIYSFNDVRELRKFEDAVVFEKRAIDVHYQLDLLHKQSPDFLSEAMFYKTAEYQIPYRTLYSKDIQNLFLAGRNFSCTHIGLSGPRVMNTTGQMGAAVGIAAALCKKHQVTPREIYQKHLKEYLALIEAQK